MRSFLLVRSLLSLLLPALFLGAPSVAWADDETPPTERTLIPPPPPEYEPPPSPAPPSDKASRRPITLGIDGYVGVNPGDGRSTPMILGSLELSYVVTPRLVLGFNHLGPAVASLRDGNHVAVTAAPFVEVYDFLNRVVQVYGQFGVPLQLAVGSAPRNGGTGVAPYGAIGLRFWLSPSFSLGFGTRLYYSATREFQYGNTLARDRGLAWNGGVSFGFHF